MKEERQMTRTKPNRLLAVLVTVILMLSMLPTVAFAADGITYMDFPFAGMANQSLNFNGNNKLTKDLEWTPTKVQQMSAGQICRLDLNGHTLTIKSMNGNPGNALFQVNGGTLIIEDSSEAQTGRILVDTGSSLSMNVVGVYNGGNFTMTGGTLECSKSGLYPLYVNNGTVEISGGQIISDNEKSAVSFYSGTLTLSSGGLQSASASPIESYPDVPITITGGNVTYPDTANLISVKSGASAQNVNISGGTFTTKIPEEYCAEGYSPTLIVIDQEGNTGYSVHEEHTGGTATCVSRAVCTLCGQEYGDVAPDAHPSLSKTEGKEATCKEAGYKDFWTCTDCNKRFADEAGTVEITEPEEIPLAAHTYSDWAVTKQPTETEKGEQKRTCTVCGYNETAEIPALDHTHTYGDWTVTKAATATTAGSRERSCTVCGYKVAETIAATGTNNTGNTSIPQTGDNSAPMLWAALLLLACGGLTGTLVYSRKRKTN